MLNLGSDVVLKDLPLSLDLVMVAIAASVCKNDLALFLDVLTVCNQAWTSVTLVKLDVEVRIIIVFFTWNK